MTPETFRLATAATHLVPALLWGTIAYDLWHYLRHRRPEGLFPRLVLALACTTTLHYATCQHDRTETVVDRERHHGNISKTAEDIGMYRQQLQQKLTELGMDVERFRRRDEQ